MSRLSSISLNLEVTRVNVRKETKGKKRFTEMQTFFVLIIYENLKCSFTPIVGFTVHVNVLFGIFGLKRRTKSFT